MIERLRYKFIYTAMASVFVVMAVILMTLNVVNYMSTNRRADEILAVLASNQGEFPEEDLMQGDRPPEFGGNPGNRLNAEVPFETRYFKVILSPEGAVQETDTSRIRSIDSQTAQSYGEEVYNEDKSHGYLDDFRYLKVDQEDGTSLILFVDNFRELSSFRTFLYSSIFIGMGSLIMIGLLVVASSKRIVEPVQKNLDQQKQFITDAGHELKTPLTIISANNDVQELLEGPTEWTESTRKQIERLDGLVEDMLSLAKIDEGTYQGERQVVDLSQLTEEATESYILLSQQQGIIFSLNIEPDIKVQADLKALEKVWSVLLDNANKYVAQGGTVRVDLSKVKKKAVFSVSNTVTDLPDDLERLFDRFYRESESRNQSDKGGYGIGLSLAQAIVEQHDGSIKATGETFPQKLIRFIVQLNLQA